MGLIIRDQSLFQGMHGFPTSASVSTGASDIMSVFTEREEPKEVTFQLILPHKQFYHNVSIINQNLETWPYLTVRNTGNLKQVYCYSIEYQGSVAQEDKVRIGQEYSILYRNEGSFLSLEIKEIIPKSFRFSVKIVIYQ